MGGQKTVKEKKRVEQSVEMLLQKALISKASDVHIEPRESLTVVRYRYGYNLTPAQKLPKTAAVKLVSYFKELAGLSSDVVSKPQFGKGEISITDKKLHLTVATVPVQDGEKVAIHIDDNENDHLGDLRSLGFWGPGEEMLDRTLAMHKGLILVSASRSTESAALIAELLKFVDIGDNKVAMLCSSKREVENDLDIALCSYKGSPEGIKTIIDKRGYTAVGLPLITSSYSMQLSLQAAKQILTLASVPANDVIHALQYAIDASDIFDCVLATRALLSYMPVPKLCIYCRESYIPPKDELRKIIHSFGIGKKMSMSHIHSLEKRAQEEGIGATLPLSTAGNQVKTFWRASITGCKQCHYTGFLHQTSISEICLIEDKLKSTLKPDIPLKIRWQKAIEDGMMSMPLDALIKSFRGEIGMATVYSQLARYPFSYSE